MTETNQLSRDTQAPPVRIVHIGLGNFTRAHQAWYTHHAGDGWGIAAFTGRRPDMAEALAPQDGLYTLITRGAQGDEYEVISSISAVHPASDIDAFRNYFRDPQVVLVTSTVTEAGYYRDQDGALNQADPTVAADLEAARTGRFGEVNTTPVKILVGLLARRGNDAGPITILPCDNLPDNGAAVRRVVRDAAKAIDPELLDWIDENVEWASCMVDRITPATTDEDIRTVQETQGYYDASPVPTEPFSEWVIGGEFNAGRPAWDEAGATLVDHVGPYEDRKLRMLNGSHSLMAYAAPLRGCATVSEAIAHPEVRDWVTSYWNEAGEGLEVEWDDYTAALVDRYENPNIAHQLAQIAADGSQKLPVRILPTIRLFRERDELPEASTRAIAAWIRHLRGETTPLKDPAAEALQSQVNTDATSAAQAVVTYLAEDLAGDQQLVELIARQVDEL